MRKQSVLKLFEDKKVRTAWDEESEKWYISIVDVAGILIDSPNPGNYWKVLKNRLKKENNQSVTDCNQLKMQSTDGKFYKTDVADVEQIFRLMQPIHLLSCAGGKQSGPIVSVMRPSAVNFRLIRTAWSIFSSF